MLHQQENLAKTMRIKDCQKYINYLANEILAPWQLQLNRRHIANPASFNSLYKKYFPVHRIRQFIDI